MKISKNIMKVRSAFYVHFKLNVRFLWYRELLERRKEVFKIDSRVIGLLHLISIHHSPAEELTFLLIPDC